MRDTERSLGQLIRARRIELGLSQEQLAEKISSEHEFVRQSDISRLETGRVSLPRFERLQALAVALELPFAALLLGSKWAEGEPEPAADRPDAAETSGTAETVGVPFDGHATSRDDRGPDDDTRRRQDGARGFFATRSQLGGRYAASRDKTRTTFERNREIFEEARRTFINTYNSLEDQHGASGANSSDT